MKQKSRMQDTEDTTPVQIRDPGAPQIDPEVLRDVLKGREGESAPAPAHLNPGAPPPDSDSEWEAMQAMMERFGRLPVKIDTADVAVTAGHMNAAHAEGPITLHGGTETKPHPDRVIIRDQVLPTAVLPRRFSRTLDLLRRYGSSIALLAAGCIAALIAIYVAKAIYFPAITTGPTVPADSALPPSVAAARRMPDLADLPEPRPTQSPPAAAIPAPLPLVNATASASQPSVPVPTGVPPTVPEVSTTPPRPRTEHAQSTGAQRPPSLATPPRPTVPGSTAPAPEPKPHYKTRIF